MSGVRLSLRAETGEIRRACLWLTRSAGEAGVPPAEVARLDTCLNEVLANVIAHGGEGAHAAPVTVCLDARPGRADVTVVDCGVAFDPVAHVRSPVAARLEEVEPGGLGIAMVREFADAIDYERLDGANRFTFRIRWGDGA